MNPMRIIVFALAFLTTTVFASPYDKASEMIANGDKQKAWDLLYPLAASEHDARAQVILGQLLLSSPNVPDHMDKALRMFNAAKRNGHPAGARFVQLTKEQLQFSNQANQRISNSKRYYAKAEREYQKLTHQMEKGFIDSSGDLFSARVDVFITEDSDMPAKVERLLQNDPLLSTQVMTKYHLVFDHSEIGTANPFSSTFRPPSDGLQPDIDGALASQLGVQSFPAIVVREAESRSPKTMTFDQLQNWSSRWRNNAQ